MSRHHSRKRVFSNESGQSLVIVVVTMVALIGMVGLVVDVGYVYRTQRALQTSADAAALAGAQLLPDPVAAQQVAQTYGASPTGANQIRSVLVNEQINTNCVATIPGCSPVNAVSVTEDATVPTIFAKVLGVASFHVHAHATACSPCGSKPVDIVLVLDRTGSMCQDSAGKADPACTDLNNAKAGIRTFLGFFDPTIAHIGLAVLPPAASPGAKCSVPTSNDYNSGSATYLVTPLSNDYRNVNGTLNSSSALVSTINCVQGGGTTSYASAIDAAQRELATNGRAGVPKIIVFFTDGAANTGPTSYSTSSPYRTKPCHQGITSAGLAKTAGTTVYSIGYALADDTGGCKSYTGAVESPAITVTQTLAQIASDSDKFLVKPAPGQLQSIYTTIAQDIAHGSSSLIN